MYVCIYIYVYIYVYIYIYIYIYIKVDDHQIEARLARRGAFEEQELRENTRGRGEYGILVYVN